MFEGRNFPKSLDEALFNSWLEKGRNSMLGYKYLLIVWDQFESNYRATFVERREEIETYQDSVSAHESLVAAYDLYSESRIV